MRQTLEAAVKSAFENLKKCPVTDIMKNAVILEKAQQALDEHLDSLITPEERSAKARYDKIKALVEKLSTMLTEQQEVCETLGIKVGKVRKESNGENNHTSNKLTYDDCQNIRKQYSEGVKVKDIAEAFGITTAVVMYKVYYLQGKLKNGDKAWTPLVNKYYPLVWTSKDGIVRSGAPYLEDGVKEDGTRYKIA
jgi:hypothetical protein